MDLFLYGEETEKQIITAHSSVFLHLCLRASSEGSLGAMVVATKNVCRTSWKMRERVRANMNNNKKTEKNNLPEKSLWNL